MAVLKPPSTSEKSESQPTAVFPTPAAVLRFLRALSPSAVLNPGYPPSGAGTTPKTFGGKKTKEAKVIAMRISGIIVLI
jgi:hypothetical protein